MIRIYLFRIGIFTEILICVFDFDKSVGLT